MKLHKIISAFLLLLYVSIPAIPGEQSDIFIDVQKHSERLLTLNVQGEANVVALNSKKGIIVVDTTVSPVLAKIVRERIEKEFGSDKFAYVINTHFHGDHTYGNQVFNDIPIIGHKNCVEGMKSQEETRKASPDRYKPVVQQMKQGLEGMDKDSDRAKLIARRIPYYEAMISGLGEGFILTPPNLTFSDSMILDLGDLTLELAYFGTCHSYSDIIIYCPEEGLWMTGDLFARGYKPYIDSERLTFLPRWIDNLKKMLSTEDEAGLIVPGHNVFLSFEDLRGYLEFMEETRETYADKESAFTIFKKLLSESDLETALKELREMKIQEDKYYVLFPEIDQYAYRMMLDNKLDEALKIFLVMADLFPDSDIAFDSLGEVYMRLENVEKAIDSFKKSLELNPDNRNASVKLKTLQKKK